MSTLVGSLSSWSDDREMYEDVGQKYATDIRLESSDKFAGLGWLVLDCDGWFGWVGELHSKMHGKEINWRGRFRSTDVLEIVADTPGTLQLNLENTNQEKLKLKVKFTGGKAQENAQYVSSWIGSSVKTQASPSALGSITLDFLSDEDDSDNKNKKDRRASISFEAFSSLLSDDEEEIDSPLQKVEKRSNNEMSPATFEKYSPNPPASSSEILSPAARSKKFSFSSTLSSSGATKPQNPTTPRINRHGLKSPRDKELFFSRSSIKDAQSPSSQNGLPRHIDVSTPLQVTEPIRTPSHLKQPRTETLSNRFEITEKRIAVTPSNMDQTQLSEAQKTPATRPLLSTESSSPFSIKDLTLSSKVSPNKSKFEALSPFSSKGTLKSTSDQNGLDSTSIERKQNVASPPLSSKREAHALTSPALPQASILSESKQPILASPGISQKCTDQLHLLTMNEEKPNTFSSPKQPPPRSTSKDKDELTEEEIMRQKVRALVRDPEHHADHSAEWLKEKFNYEVSFIPTPTKERLERSPARYIKPGKDLIRPLKPIVQQMKEDKDMQDNMYQEATHVKFMGKKGKMEYMDLSTQRVLDPAEYASRYLNYVTTGASFKQKDSSSPKTCKNIVPIGDSTKCKDENAQKDVEEKLRLKSPEPLTFEKEMALAEEALHHAFDKALAIFIEKRRTLEAKYNRKVSPYRQHDGIENKSNMASSEDPHSTSVCSDSLPNSTSRPSGRMKKPLEDSTRAAQAEYNRNQRNRRKSISLDDMMQMIEEDDSHNKPLKSSSSPNARVLWRADQ